MSAGSTCQDTDYARHIQEILDELGVFPFSGREVK